MDRKIPVNEYKDEMYVTIDLIRKYHTPAEIKKINTWMMGQTCTTGPNGQIYMYSWDYEKWLSVNKI